MPRTAIVFLSGIGVGVLATILLWPVTPPHPEADGAARSVGGDSGSATAGEQADASYEGLPQDVAGTEDEANDNQTPLQQPRARLLFGSAPAIQEGRSGPAAASPDARRIERLVAEGFTEERAKQIDSRFGELMEEGSPQSRASANSPLYILREELGDDELERFLKAIGRSSDVVVRGVADDPAADDPAADDPTADLREGRDYRLIDPPQAKRTDAGQVEVAEIFQYGCPHCFTFEPMLEAWLEQKADYVNFVRLPAAWNPAAEVHARAYYTAEALDKLDEMHLAFFNAIHNEGNPLTSEDALAEFFARFGVGEQTFTRAFNSFSVSAQVAQANELIRRYGVGATPNVVVEGKYLTDRTMAGTFERWFAIIDALAAREHEYENGRREFDRTAIRSW